MSKPDVLSVAKLLHAKCHGQDFREFSGCPYWPCADLNKTAEQIAKLKARNGDVIFFDPEIHNLETIVSMRSPGPEQDDVLFIPVHFTNGLYKLPKEDARSLFEDHRT